jgi:NAD(P)-dependent dehydrogenase (short-subunit alcohol dehydrogenase family)
VTDLAPRRLAFERFRLDGRVAVVTGASSGLGLAFAQSLAEAGADVALGARRGELIDAACTMVEGLGRQAAGLVMDVTDPDECEALVAAAMERFGQVDVLVNNAGTSDAVPALRQSRAEFLRVLDVNLNGAFWMAQACGRVMRPGSAVVNVSSVIGLAPGDVPSASYAASKAALLGLTRELAKQWAGRSGIRVNALAPGYFATDMTAPLLAHDGLSGAVLDRTPMRRLGDPVELCSAMLFLASDASSYVTGVTLPVDGGWSMP